MYVQQFFENIVALNQKGPLSTVPWSIKFEYLKFTCYSRGLLGAATILLVFYNMSSPFL